ncbi:XkdX family protein [Clostridium tepidum]|nr:XkdX family protein [Clostridium tepidum]MCR1933516.1 XkdX family protein [Clostridium tepidum]
MLFDVIKEYYIINLYTESDLDIFVNAKWITEEQKQDIIDNKVKSQ